jgi:hypothetical protein
MMWNYLNHATLDSFRQMHKFNYRKRDRNTSSSLSTTRNGKLVIDIPTNWVKNSTDCQVDAFFRSVSGQTGWVLRKISLLYYTLASEFFF